MRQMLSLTIILAFAFFGFSSVPAYAYDECITNVAAGGHWPNPKNISGFGTQKWEFDWRVNPLEGIEISNVKYTSDLSQPKKLVIKRASLPFLPVHYPESAPTCGGPPHGYDDQLGSQMAPLCCAHVPTTICNTPDRVMACMPTYRDVSVCPSGAPLCKGVCEGTQVDLSSPIEDGVGETVSGAADADIVLTGAFQLGGYQFIQRWRFRDNGTLIPSMRAGGVHNCQFHNHQIYWRLNFQLAATPNESIQECGSGGCPDLAVAGWNPVTGCNVGSTSSASWRITDTGTPGRAVVVRRGPNDGDPSNFCQGTSTECGVGGCVNTRDFCALAAAEPTETFTPNNCNDHLANAGGTSPDLAFWYIAHVDHHDPCSFLPMCDPAIGTVAFGPTIRLVGSW